MTSLRSIEASQGKETQIGQLEDSVKQEQGILDKTFGEATTAFIGLKKWWNGPDHQSSSSQETMHQKLTQKFNAAQEQSKDLGKKIEQAHTTEDLDVLAEEQKTLEEALSELNPQLGEAENSMGGGSGSRPSF